MNEPLLRRFYLVALRDAAMDLWGDRGVEAILGGMPGAEREEARGEQRRDWVPERVIVAWGLATWEGPAARDRATFNRFLAHHVDHGFGRIHRMLMRLASPARFFERAPEYWRQDHSHGALEATAEGGTGVVRLRAHPYVETPHARAAIAEIFRYSLECMRASHVTESHAVEEDGALAIRLRWQ